MGSRPLVPRILRVLLAVGVATFVAPAASHAHGDGPTHYLETQGFYPGVSPAPSPKVELQLMGYVQAAQQAGYPMRVAVANEGELGTGDAIEILSSDIKRRRSVISPALLSPLETALARSTHGARAWWTRTARRFQAQIRLAGSRRQPS